MNQNLSKSELFIVEFLKGRDYTSPTVIGYAHRDANGLTGDGHHSAWASKKCLKLVEKGLLLRNKRGQYKLAE